MDDRENLQTLFMDTIEESVDMSNLGGYQKLTTFAKKLEVQEI